MGGPCQCTAVGDVPKCHHFNRARSLFQMCRMPIKSLRCCDDACTSSATLSSERAIELFTKFWTPPPCASKYGSEIGLWHLHDGFGNGIPRVLIGIKTLQYCTSSFLRYSKAQLGRNRNKLCLYCGGKYPQLDRSAPNRVSSLYRVYSSPDLDYLPVLGLRWADKNVTCRNKYPMMHDHQTTVHAFACRQSPHDPVLHRDIPLIHCPSLPVSTSKRKQLQVALQRGLCKFLRTHIKQ